jgi:hypothetical protein
MSLKFSYSRVDDAVIRRLVNISGPNAVLSDDEVREKYSRDETIGLSYPPEVIVLPGT